MSSIANAKTPKSAPAGQRGPSAVKAKEVGIEAQPAARELKRPTRRAKPASRVISQEGEASVDTQAKSVPATAPIGDNPKPISKQDIVLGMLRQTEGATIVDLMDATSWQAHSVRGFLSGTVRKKLNLQLISDLVGNGIRRYRIASADLEGRGSEAGDQQTADSSASVQGA